MSDQNIDISRHLGNEYYGSALQSEKYGMAAVERRQLTAGNFGHYGYPNFPPDRNVGGPFILKGFYKRWGTTHGAEFYRGGPLNQTYNGCFTADFIVGSEGYPSSIAPADAWGATAYAKLKPTKPVFSGLNAIYELREFPEMLRQRFLDPKNPLKSIGNYWLALKFGWQPLLQDIRNTVLFQQRAQKKLKWLIANNGKPTRSKVTLQDSFGNFTSGTGSNYGALQPVLVTQYYSQVPKYTIKRWETDKVWASGRFRFWLPPGPQDIAWERRMMAYLFGLDPTPEVIYNMIPWSWLLDWFTNAGDCLAMLDSGVADRLAADYWYVMRDKAVEITYDCSGEFVDRWGNKIPVTASSSNRSFSKYRTAGSPFGFNFNPVGLSPMQLSILGALGLSRSSG